MVSLHTILSNDYWQKAWGGFAPHEPDGNASPNRQTSKTYFIIGSSNWREFVQSRDICISHSASVSCNKKPVYTDSDTFDVPENNQPVRSSSSRTLDRGQWTVSNPPISHSHSPLSSWSAFVNPDSSRNRPRVGFTFDLPAQLGIPHTEKK